MIYLYINICVFTIWSFLNYSESLFNVHEDVTYTVRIAFRNDGICGEGPV